MKKYKKLTDRQIQEKILSNLVSIKQMLILDKTVSLALSIANQKVNRHKFPKGTDFVEANINQGEQVYPKRKSFEEKINELKLLKEIEKNTKR